MLAYIIINIKFPDKLSFHQPVQSFSAVMGFRQVVFMVPYDQTVTVDSVYCTNIIVPLPANVMVECQHAAWTLTRQTFQLKQCYLLVAFDILSIQFFGSM
jgi:hypothetical protein